MIAQVGLIVGILKLRGVLFVFTVLELYDSRP